MVSYGVPGGVGGVEKGLKIVGGVGKLSAQQIQGLAFEVELGAFCLFGEVGFEHAAVDEAFEKTSFREQFLALCFHGVLAINKRLDEYICDLKQPKTT